MTITLAYNCLFILLLILINFLLSILSPNLNSWLRHFLHTKVKDLTKYHVVLHFIFFNLYITSYTRQIYHVSNIDILKNY